MIHSSLRVALGALALGLAAPAVAFTLDVATEVVDDVPVKKKKGDEKPKTVTVWVLEAKGSS